MARLFGRRCELVLGEPPQAGDFSLRQPTALRITNLTTRFKVEKTDDAKPNTAEITILNLSSTSRAKLTKRGVRVVLSAGYEGEGLQLVFGGDEHSTFHEHKRPEWVTTMICADGGRAFAYARSDRSFPSGSSKADVVAALVKDMGVGEGNIAQKISKFIGAFKKGFATSGNAAEQLDKMVRGQGLGWSIQNGQVEILGPGETLELQVPLISSATGMVGSPSLSVAEDLKKPATLKVRTLLRPDLRPGVRFVVASESVAGAYKAKRVVHTGDTSGRDWYTDLEAEVTT